MTDFVFETMTPAEALAIGLADRVTLSSGPASQVSIAFLGDGTFSMTLGSRTLIFNGNLAALSAGGRVASADGSTLYVGTPGIDQKDFGPINPIGGAVYGGAGGDSLSTGTGSFLIQGNQGADVITAYGPSNTIYGGQDGDVIRIVRSDSVAPSSHFIQGNLGDDQITGGLGADTLLGGRDNDVISGVGGADFLNGNLGDDRITGTGQLFGEDGNDTLAASGPSTAMGGAGNDVISAVTPQTAPNGMLFGDGGDDTVTAAGGATEEVYGGDGDDMLRSLQQSVATSDLLVGGAGNDTLSSEANPAGDTLSGGEGADVIRAGGGADVLIGGGGADRFIISTRNPALPISRILDWSSEDRLDFTEVARDKPPYFEVTAPGIGDSAEAARVALAGGYGVVAVQVAGDVYLFASLGGTPAPATVLVGRSLADISGDNVF